MSGIWSIYTRIAVFVKSLSPRSADSTTKSTLPSLIPLSPIKGHDKATCVEIFLLPDKYIHIEFPGSGSPLNRPWEYYGALYQVAPGKVLFIRSISSDIVSASESFGVLACEGSDMFFCSASFVLPYVEVSFWEWGKDHSHGVVLVAHEATNSVTAHQVPSTHNFSYLPSLCMSTTESIRSP